MGRKTVVVTGIAGVGKTAVLNELSRLCEQGGKKVKIVNYANIMLETAKKEGMVIERDTLRRMPIELQQVLQAKAVERIEEATAGGEAVIIDTHMIIRTGVGYWAGLPYDVLRRLRPSLFVLLEADPDEILVRRFRDEGRRRDPAAAEELRTDLEFSRSVAAACATLTGAPVRFLMNPQGKLAEVARQLMDLLWG